MKPVTLVATDLDGTLLTNKKLVSPRTKIAIKELKKHGILFGVVSGRPVESGLKLMKDWGLENDISFLIGMNGGAIYDIRTGEKEEWYLMNGEVIKDIIHHFDGMDLIFQAMIGNDRYTSASTPETQAHAKLYGENEIETDLDEFLPGKKINKLVIFHSPERQEEVKERAKDMVSDLYVHCATADNLYEFMDPHINKGFGIEKAEEHYGVNRENVVAFGDNDNDVQMLLKAGTGVAMSNASPAAKEAADIILEYSNEQDGLGDFLNKEILPNALGYVLPHPVKKL